MKKRILGLGTVFALCCTAALAGKTAKPGVSSGIRASITAIQAELMADLHARLLKPGGTVYARVTVDWQSKDCVLASGAILEGHVIDVVPHIKTVKGVTPNSSKVSLAFTKAQCGGPKMGSFALLLSAMAAPPRNQDLGVMSDSLPLLLTGSNGGGFAALASMHTSAYVNYDLQTEIYRFPLSPDMQMGYVSGLKGLTLSVGTGPENSSVLTAKDRDVSLEKHTLILFVPAEGAFPGLEVDPNGVQHGASLNNGNSDTETAPAPPPVEEIDRCVPPECSEALPPGDAIDAGRVEASFSIRQLGYAPRPQREMDSFDHDEALAYLGPRELLVAFNPHKLVTRHSLGKSGSTVRIIRASLMDTATHQVLHSVDWELPDNRQYLWPLSDGRVLVHVGSELRIYGEELKILNRINLDGPLAFVRVTPDGNFIALGIIRERHTPELHAQLSQNLNHDPEEDVSVLVLNRKFETIAKSTARSGLMAPTLLNEGQAKLQALPNSRYRISLQTWDSRARTITQFSSSCTPELSSIAPDLLFLVSCDKQTQGREYRVLRPDGKLALKGDSGLNECGQAAEGNASHETFVVKLVQSTMPMSPGTPFNSAEFSSEDLGVYRAVDGKRLFSVRVGSPSSSRDGYALAPDGSQLAVLTREQVAVYSVPVK